jgi:adenylate cyclase
LSRKLAAILVADVAGYSRLMGQDEEGTLAALNTHVSELIAPEIAKHAGRTVKSTGDGLLVEFPSVVDAVRCAAAIQNSMPARSAGVTEDKRFQLRIAVNLGDIIVEGQDIFGDGVNVAARLEGLCEPGGIVLSASAYEQVKNKVPLIYEDMGVQVLKNIADPVRVYQARADRTGGTFLPSIPPEMPDKPSIAVLPFTNMGGNPNQRYFTDGITEDIITELARFKSLFVIARNSSFQYRDQAVDVRKVGRELGVRYVLEGSIRTSVNRVRITSQLVECSTGSHIWSEKYDRGIDDLFAVQDEVTRAIVASLTGRLEDAEIKTVTTRRTGSHKAYDLVLRGIERFRGYGDSDNRIARELFEEAVSVDPRYGLAQAYLGMSLLVEHGHGNAPAEIKDRALACILEAVRLEPGESRCHQFLGQAYRFRNEIDLALRHFEHAVSLNPNDANGIAQMGAVLAIAGRAEEGVEAIHRAMRLNPIHPDWYWGGLAYALYAARRYEEALDANRRLGASKRPWVIARGAACLAQMGRLGEARMQAREVLRLDPDFRISSEMPFYKKPGDAEHIREGMLKAGLPD